jgi:hypothetical protein
MSRDLSIHTVFITFLVSSLFVLVVRNGQILDRETSLVQYSTVHSLRRRHVPSSIWENPFLFKGKTAIVVIQRKSLEEKE